MTARLATHADVASRTAEVIERLDQAGVDVDPVDTRTGPGSDVGTEELLGQLRDAKIDLALVGLSALRGSAADDLTTVAVFPRDPVRDVLVTLTGDPTPLIDLPAGGRIGVVGARRSAFLAAHRPDLEGVPLTRSQMADLLKGSGAASDTHGVTAIVVSALEARLAGLVETTVEALDAKAWLPEPGQGVLALVARHPIAEATALDHLPTRTALRTELALVDALGPEAGAALGCLAQPSGRWIRLWAAVASPDGRRLVRSDRTGPLDEAEALGVRVARELEARGVSLVAADAGS